MVLCTLQKCTIDWLLLQHAASHAILVKTIKGIEIIKINYFVIDNIDNCAIYG